MADSKKDLHSLTTEMLVELLPELQHIAKVASNDVRVKAVALLKEIYEVTAFSAQQELIADELNNLNTLRTRKILTDDEFEKQKAKLLR